MIEYMRGAPKLSGTVAICHYHRHYGNLSPKLMKQHDCLRKNCPFLERVEIHSFWERRAERRALRKARKAELSSQPERGIKKEGRIGIVRTQEKSVYRENLPVNDAFSDLMSLFACTAYPKWYYFVIGQCCHNFTGHNIRSVHFSILHSHPHIGVFFYHFIPGYSRHPSYSLSSYNLWIPYYVHSFYILITTDYALLMKTTAVYQFFFRFVSPYYF